MHGRIGRPRSAATRSSSRRRSPPRQCIVLRGHRPLRLVDPHGSQPASSRDPQLPIASLDVHRELFCRAAGDGVRAGGQRGPASRRSDYCRHRPPATGQHRTRPAWSAPRRRTDRPHGRAGHHELAPPSPDVVSLGWDRGREDCAQARPGREAVRMPPPQRSGRIGSVRGCDRGLVGRRLRRVDLLRGLGRLVKKGGWDSRTGGVRSLVQGSPPSLAAMRDSSGTRAGSPRAFNTRSSASAASASGTPFVSGEQQADAGAGRGRWSGRCGCDSDGTDVRSLRAFRALRRAELDPLTFLERPEAR
jgi:hypothetical protein